MNVQSINLSSIRLGATLKIFNQNIAGRSSMLFAGDVGGQIKMLNDNKLGVGLMIKNLGASGAIGSESDSMPITFQIGGSWEQNFNVHKIIGLLGSDIMLDESPSINIGAEYIFNSLIFGRLGYRIGTSPSNLSFVKGLSFGMGGYYNNFTFDISWGSMDILGNLIQTTVSYKFDSNQSTTEENPEEMTEKQKEAEKLYYKGINLYTNDKFQEAIKTWEQVLKLDPNYEKAKEKIKDAQDIIQQEKK